MDCFWSRFSETARTGSDFRNWFSRNRLWEPPSLLLSFLLLLLGLVSFKDGLLPLPLLLFLPRLLIGLLLFLLYLSPGRLLPLDPVLLVLLLPPETLHHDPLLPLGHLALVAVVAGSLLADDHPGV